MDSQDYSAEKPSTFGKRLRVARALRDISQAELRREMFRLCGVEIGATYISELEGTEKTPTLKVAAAMAEVLGVSLDYFGLLVNEPVSYKRQATPEVLTDAVANFLVEQFGKKALEQEPALP